MSDHNHLRNPVFTYRGVKASMDYRNIVKQDKFRDRMDKFGITAILNDDQLSMDEKKAALEKAFNDRAEKAHTEAKAWENQYHRVLNDWKLLLPDIFALKPSAAEIARAEEKRRADEIAAKAAADAKAAKAADDAKAAAEKAKVLARVESSIMLAGLPTLSVEDRRAILASKPHIAEWWLLCGTKRTAVITVDQAVKAIRHGYSPLDVESIKRKF
jgi:hypothetical protein